jgi:uracil-DNA glycosylase
MIIDVPSHAEKIIGKLIAVDVVKELISRTGLTNVIIAPMVACRPLEGAMPKPAEIVACMPNMLQLIEDFCPSFIVLFGDIVDHNYRRILKDDHPITTLTHPSVLEMQGGISSPIFRDNLNKLQRMVTDYVI